MRSARRGPCRPRGSRSPGRTRARCSPSSSARVAAGELSLRGVNETTLEIPEGLLVDADTPAALADLERLA